MADGFLGRWSRRKLDAKDGKPLPPEPAAGPPAAAVDAAPAAQAAPGNVQGAANGTAASPVAGAGTPAPAPDRQPAAAPEPPPSLEDVKALTPESDFRRFAARGVAPEVKNAAMKKLFADPRFNVQDGLDIYIGDYTQPDPIPESMLKQLASARFLGLFREEERKDEQQLGPAGPTDELVGESVAQSGAPESDTPAAASAAPDPDVHPDLRLQQDDAAPGQEPGRSTG
ncbi:MAG TPA: DUF3306 domain-containing protein [Ramlibacter sp.]|jgi:hypothetical protein|uniref:DUF3306 domain-containing protein n=1 Tax=Ramlibacter sp. TaxID=1917967 RepID=UPI002D2E7A56|nr:DUF3306 domain-containing protein [Ramlibacter sp.]HZY17551.1 DUF3306 domain-containing protein [Ramlibacter sp.]